MSSRVHLFSMESSSLSILPLLLLCLLLFFHIPHSHSHTSSNKTQPKCHEEERNALLEFKSTFYNESCTFGFFDLQTWIVEAKNGDCCNWEGIECNNHSGHVIGLHIFNSCLSGSINSSNSLFKLSHLKTLDLSWNDFRYSKIPSAISNFSQLEFLKLDDSNFSGQIPLEILNLTSLSYLSLSFNQLTLQNPSLGDLTQSLIKLKELHLSSVEISSSIPASLPRLTSLLSLGLFGCKLQGQVPPSLSNLTNLRHIDVWDNQLTGEIFPHLLKLTKLRDVSLSYNRFSGQIPRTISHLKHLTYLSLESNNFTGKLHLDAFFQLENLSVLGLSYNNFSFVMDSRIKPKSKIRSLGLASCNLRSFPLWLRSQDLLAYLDLSSNDMSGEVPEWFFNVSIENLSTLNLSHNHLLGFEGNFSLLKWDNLEYLDLGFNQLKGSLPIPSTNSSLQYYLVSNNEFSGEIPPRMCNAVDLKIFDIANNSLSGMIPQCLANLVGLGNLSVLNLRSNSFNGPIPQVGKNRCNLVMIDMSHNQLEGPVPRDMENCLNLEFLNLGNNKINDVFPFWLGKLPVLSILILCSNRFHGSMGKPLDGYEFSKLQIINLSINNLTGYLPAQYFEGWRAMKVDAHKGDRTMSYAYHEFRMLSYFYSVTMINKGINIEYTEIQESLAGVDFSSNYFIGEIPKSITTLWNLHFLNLSNNLLTGPIPFNLNSLMNLETVDLSHNKLSGGIPQQLTDLTMLSSFDISFNQLKGPIPHSKQFDTFENSSYLGNVGLCGPPLSRKCGNITEASSPPSLGEDHASRTWVEINWTIVSLGYSSGFVVGVVMGMHWKRGCKRVKRVRHIKFVLI